MDRGQKQRGKDALANLKCRRTPRGYRGREREIERQRAGRGGGEGGEFVFDLSACLLCCFPSRLPGKFQ